MTNRRFRLGERAGLTRLHGILLVLIVVMCVVITIPAVRSCNADGEAVACAAGLDTAQRRLAQDIIEGNSDQDALEAKEVVTVAMNGWDDLCPGGGRVYLVRAKSGNMPFLLVCGKHDSDKKRCTRLNSGYVLQQLQENLRRSRLLGEAFPKTLTFELNGERWTARLTDEEVPFRRGTSTTRGYEDKGTVAFYGIKGHSDFCAGSAVKDGEICYFSFADPQHCAMWQQEEGWTGDSYGVR